MKQPVKIAHVVLGLNVGGLERMVLRLVERTSRARFSPMVCTLGEPGELASELARSGVPLMPLRPSGGLGARLDTTPPRPWIALQLAAWLRREDIGLVHTHNPSPHVWGALAAALARSPRLPGRKRAFPRVVHTRHGRNFRWAQRRALVSRVASALTDRFVAVSENSRDIAVEVERLDPAKVLTILNGVDTDEYRPGGDPRAIRARLGLPAGGFHIACVARLSTEKDHATLLAALAALRQTRRDAHLTLIGDGALRAPLEEEAARLGVKDAVTFTGTRHDVASLLPAFDVFALASRTEGISLTLLEAAAAGLPLVATRVGGTAEIIDDGRTGLLVPPGAPLDLARALATVAARPERAEMGRRGRDRVIERFSAAQMVRAYEDLYAEVLEGE